MAAARIAWAGADGNWGTGSNWSTGVQPEYMDDVVIDAGSQAITGSDNSTLYLNTLTIGAGYTGNIGSAGSPLQVDADILYYNGSSDCYIDGTFTTGIVVDSGNKSENALVINTNSSNDVGNVTISRGRITLAGKNLITDVTISQGGVCTMSTGCSVSGGYNQSGGVTTSNATLSGTTNVSGGTFEQDSGTMSLLQHHGGDFFFDAGTLTEAHLYGGNFNASRTSSVKTFTNIYMYDGVMPNFRDKTRGINGTITYRGDAMPTFNYDTSVTLI
jgi:hypothetical protein